MAVQDRCATLPQEEETDFKRISLETSKSNLGTLKRKVLKALLNKYEIIIIPAHKGNMTVDKDDYDRKLKFPVESDT